MKQEATKLAPGSDNDSLTQKVERKGERENQDILKT